eukprot:Tamp_13633.p1 GENE.Tamp_13633~~Tamp_13633.p1  ORF type:complete len:464 (+),score=52.27 Tamp_13633:300-1691(+)
MAWLSSRFKVRGRPTGGTIRMEASADDPHRQGFSKDSLDGKRGGRARHRPSLAILALLALQLGACAGPWEQDGEGECNFVEQLVDVHCRGLELVRLPCARAPDVSEAEHKVSCCRQACCRQERCQMFVTNILIRDDVENVVRCWMGNHTLVACDPAAGAPFALGWVGERAKTSSVFADDYLSHLLLTVAGMETETQSLTQSLGWSDQGRSISNLHLGDYLRLVMLHDFLLKVARDAIPGDVIDAGSWRGGAAVFAAGVIRRRRMNRRVFACGHSYESRGAPSTTSDSAFDSHEDDTGAWSVSEQHVLDTCASFGVFAVSSSSSSATPYFPASSAAPQPEVIVVPGPLLQALPQLDAQRVALLHVDACSFEGTLQTLELLYPHLSRAAMVIIGDMSILPVVRAVYEFRRRHAITDHFSPAGGRALMWRKSQDVAAQTPEGRRLREWRLKVLTRATTARREAGGG